MHDLVGMRIVRSMSRDEQDELAARVSAVFADGSRKPLIIDRRATPTAGYRAVHVVVFPDGVPVEIQIRTRWQHEWAELFEKLADQYGRRIRYGEPATTPVGEAGVKAALMLADFIAAGEQTPTDIKPAAVAYLLGEFRRILEQYS